MDNSTVALSKEEVLLGYVGLQPNSFPDTLVMEAMEHYAEQQSRIRSIAFAEWMAIRGYKRSQWYHDKWYIPTTPQIVETNQPTTEELFQKFIQETKNKLKPLNP